MAKSQRLRLKDIREIFLLVGECRELGVDPIAWRMHMQRRLCEILGGAITIYTESTCVSPPGNKGWLRIDLHLDQGWASDTDRDAMFRLYETDEPDMDGSPLNEKFMEGPTLAAARREVLLDDRPWYGGMFFNEFMQPAHKDDALMLRTLRGNELHLLVIQRELGESRFQLRQQRVLKLFGREVAQEFGRTLAPRGGFSVTDLPPRLKQVLKRLLEGDNEKQAALRLGISPHTVHDYVKSLHLRFGVQSRGELLARAWPYYRALSQTDR
jgi:DNA-binding CsgD family transcriptional regulator